MRTHHRILAALGLVPMACTSTPSATRQRPTSSTAPTVEAAGPEEGTPTPESGPAPGDTTTTTEEPTTTTSVVTIAGLPTTTTIPPRTATTFLVEHEQTDEEWWAAQPGAGGQTRDVLLACIRSYESGGDYGAVSDSGQYRGAYQFDLSTWESVGGSGDPADAEPAEQDARAWSLYQARGLSPWPTPARRCR